MPAKKREDLRAALKKSEFAEVYLLHGPEGYLRDSAARAITEAAMKDAPLREFNDISFSLLETDINEALSAAEQIPMMSERRVVRIAELGRSRSEGQREAEEEAVLKYVERPAPTSVVIFTTSDLDKRRKFTKTLVEKCFSIEFAPLDNKALVQWANERIRDLQATIDNATVNYLVELVGNDVRTLTTEIDKLATAALPNGVITRGLIDQLVPRSREQDNFELTNRLVANDRVGAMRILHRMMDDGAEPLMVIGLLAANYHKLVITNDLFAHGMPAAEVTKVVGWKPDSFMSAARRANPVRLAQSMNLIAAADLAIKTSVGTPRMQIEILVCELAAQTQ